TATWTGTVQSFTIFDHPFFQTSIGASGPTDTDTVDITIPSSGLCSGAGNGPTPCAIPTTTQTISLPLSPNEALVKASGGGVTLNITATKTGIIGTLSDTDGHTGSIDGVTITANRAYLLNVTLNGDPSAACNPAQFQGTASIVPSNLKLLIFTGSGIDFDCSQQIVSGRFTKP
ncbi:MAG TPA: hypothetical protein VGA73_07350, partial [Candidatus Binatia bacterium]